jgi:hypothetical protein
MNEIREIINTQAYERINNFVAEVNEEIVKER